MARVSRKSQTCAARLNNRVDANFKLVLVEWVDSFHLEAGWHWLEDLPERRLGHCHSVGWVIREDDEQISLSETISDVGDSHQVSGIVTIPVCAITKRKTLTSSSAC